MTTLSHVDILAEVGQGIEIDPFLLECVMPASLDLRLAPEYLELMDGAVLDAHKDNTEYFVKRTMGRQIVLLPGTLILGQTVEKISLGPYLLAHLSGRSSLGRLGVLVHVTAGVIDPGWSGRLTLEIMNLTQGPVIIYPGDRIAQLTFEYLLTPTDKLYAGKYQGAAEPQPSRMYQDV